MPTYDMRCENEHYFEITCRILEKDDQVCEVCGEHLHTLITAPPAIIGAMPSKPIDFEKQLGRKFETNEEYRQYFRDNPEAEVISKSSDRYINMRDRLRNKMDHTARGQGYRDHEDKMAKVKANKANKT